MRIRHGDSADLGENSGAAHPKLPAKVAPLVEQLPAGLRDSWYGRSRADFFSVKPVAAPGCFLLEPAKECGDCRKRPRAGLEPGQLWVVAVAPRPAGKDLLRKQGLAPGRDQAFGIEVAWVDGPKPHVRYSKAEEGRPADLFDEKDWIYPPSGSWMACRRNQ